MPPLKSLGLTTARTIGEPLEDEIAGRRLEFEDTKSRPPLQQFSARYNERIRRQLEAIHRLGPVVLGYLVEELAAGGDLREVLKEFAAIDPAIVAAQRRAFCLADPRDTPMIAAGVSKALCGHHNGKGFLCRCPIPSHGKGNADRSVCDGDKGLLVRCFSGCDPRDVLAERRRLGLLEDRELPKNLRSRTARLPLPEPEPEPDRRALELWCSAIPAQGTLAEQYLRSRGISISIPQSLRFLQYIDYMPRIGFPAMVAAVQRPDRKIIAVQITFLDPCGDCKAQVAAPRKTIGALGRGAVRLGSAGACLGIAVGTESALSAMQLFATPVWACLGAGRAQNVMAPECVKNLRVFADGDAPPKARSMENFTNSNALSLSKRG